MSNLIWERKESDFPTENILVDLTYDPQSNTLDISLSESNNCYLARIKDPLFLCGYVTNFLKERGLNPASAKFNLSYRGLIFEWSETENVWPPTLDSIFLIEGILKDISRYEQNYDSLFDLGTGSGIIGVSIGKIKSFDETFLCDINPHALKKAKRTAQRNNLNVTTGSYEKLESKLRDRKPIFVANPPYFDIATFKKDSKMISGLDTEITKLGGFNLSFYGELKRIIDLYNSMGYFTTSDISEKELDFLTRDSEKIDSIDFPLSNLKDAFNLKGLPESHTVNLWRYIK